MTHPTMFAELDGLGINLESTSGDTVLDEWYASVRKVPVNELEIGDLARACRQKIYLQLIVPAVAARLENDPLAGDIYDGELIKSLLSIPQSYWLENPRDAGELRKIATKAANLSDDDVREYFTELKVLLGE